MTDQELKDLVASLAIRTERLFAAQAETARQLQLNSEQQKLTDEQLKQTEEQLKLTSEQQRLTSEQQKQTDKQIKELGRQIGGLGNKFGSFTEGLAMPSVQKLLFERFGVEDFMPRRRKRVGGKMIELDALGIVNGTRNEAYVVEIKSHLRTEAVQQMRDILHTFRSLFPEYQAMKLYGIIAAADASLDALAEAQGAGLYVLTFEEDLMRFHEEGGFTPQAY
jgi:hypothetical protein